MIWHCVHPDMRAKIEGAKRPKWSLIKEKVFLLANYMSFLNYVGWDVVLTKDGEVAIIGANNCSGINVLRVHGLLLENEQVKKFYKYHKVI